MCLPPGDCCVQIAAVHQDRMLNHDNVRVCTACSMLHGTDTLADKLPSISCPGACLPTAPCCCALQTIMKVWPSAYTQACSPGAIFRALAAAPPLHASVWHNRGV